MSRTVDVGRLTALYAQGKTAFEVAVEMGVGTNTVSKWVAKLKLGRHSGPMYEPGANESRRFEIPEETLKGAIGRHPGAWRLLTGSKREVIGRGEVH